MYFQDSAGTNRHFFRWLIGRAVTVGAYLCLFALAYWLAFAFRYDFDLQNAGFGNCYRSLLWVLLLKLAVFSVHRHFHSYGFYASFRDLQVLVKSSFISAVGIFIVASYILGMRLPRTVTVLDCLFTICLIGAVRFGWRILRREILPRFTKRSYKKTVLIGANNQGVLLAHELYDHPELGYKMVGFVSLHEQKVGRYMSQIPVLGHINGLETILVDYGIQEVLISPGILSGDPLRNVISICQKRNIRLRIVPSMETRLGGASVPIRELNIEDLLKREPIKLDDSRIEKLISGQKVLVTGAGGSIGSEICRQIIRFNPETLVILGRGENRIFFLEKELRQLGCGGNLVSVIGDVTNETRMEQVFRDYLPQVVFHAAAHKHVPLMEANMSEAVYNNVKGTKITADMADRFETKTFVLISTDKAVNPTSVMGATKHLAERYVHSLSLQSPTKFVVTRFGNVLGSAGSVVPIFRKQIAEGGPVTVTDFRMTRYFMTIPEASQLVLQAAAMGDGGEIFVLDMGEPVRIIDLAKDLIRLSGLPENSIEIRETGMRPGEKLYEELYFDSEKAIRTAHPKLRCAAHRRFDWNVVNEQIRELLEMTVSPVPEIQNKLQAIIEEYQPERKTATVPFIKSGLSVFPTETEKLRKTG
jgi:FlaA1/EpsC-like NDP-sugar epimerase